MAGKFLLSDSGRVYRESPVLAKRKDMRKVDGRTAADHLKAMGYTSKDNDIVRRYSTTKKADGDSDEVQLHGKNLSEFGG